MCTDDNNKINAVHLIGHICVHSLADMHTGCI